MSAATIIIQNNITKYHIQHITIHYNNQSHAAIPTNKNTNLTTSHKKYPIHNNKKSDAISISTFIMRHHIHTYQRNYNGAGTNTGSTYNNIHHLNTQHNNRTGDNYNIYQTNNTNTQSNTTHQHQHTINRHDEIASDDHK